MARKLSLLEIRAGHFGADYLLSVAGWVLKTQPRSLQQVRADYRRFCVALLRRIERAGGKTRKQASA